jgi:nitrite reductase/ring-hydroxylating ferredoxin subunit/uncharacterized membrane protein
MNRTDERPRISAGRALHDLLEGKPLRHPLHPLLAHLPVGLWTLSFVLDLASWLAGPQTNALVTAAAYAMLAGLVTAIVAAVFGLADWVDIRADHPQRYTAYLHLALNLVVIGLYGVNYFLRTGRLDAVATPLGLVALSLAALGLLYVSGYLGGSLVYNDGIAVGRHRRPGHTPGETLRAPAARTPGEFVPVAFVERMQRTPTPRVEANGYVLTLVRQGGEYYAVQEFCTHRHGPLSEGSLHDGQIQCPWHRSCFDVRTGRVTQGPAKADLKTFEVRVVDDVIQVRVPAEPPSYEQAEQAAERGEARERAE